MCEVCLEGKHAAAAGSVECVTCGAGRFSSLGATSCAACSAGTASSGSAASCAVCPEGSVSSSDRSLCSPCKPGTEAVNGSCVACSAGLYNDEAGKPCRQCEVGTISTVAEALVCRPCAYSYTTTAEGATQCDGCIEGYFRDPAVKKEGRWCVRCPENAFCAGDLVPGTTLLPVPLPGFWSDRSDVTLLHKVHACPRGEEVCTGGLKNVSTLLELELEDEVRVARPQCWLPEHLVSDACSGDEILW